MIPSCSASAPPDRITDFGAGDLIALQATIRKIGPTGVLAADRFHLGDAAETRKQKILYDADSGRLLYARKGSDTDNPHTIAKIGKHLDDLDHTDMLVM